MRSVLSARAVHCSATSLPLQSQTVCFFSIEQEWLKLGLRCLPFTGPIGQVSKVGESLRGLGFPLGTLLLSLAERCCWCFLVGGRWEVQLQEALLAWGPFSQRFPWAEPGCMRVSCSACGQARG